MSEYLSRGEIHLGSSEEMLGSWSEQEKDEVAALLLGVVSWVVENHKRWELMQRWEPTTTGHLGADVRDFVLKKSA